MEAEIGIYYYYVANCRLKIARTELLAYFIVYEWSWNYGKMKHLLNSALEEAQTLQNICPTIFEKLAGPYLVCSLKLPTLKHICLWCIECIVSI